MKEERKEGGWKEEGDNKNTVKEKCPEKRNSRNKPQETRNAAGAGCKNLTHSSWEDPLEAGLVVVVKGQLEP